MATTVLFIGSKIIENTKTITKKFSHKWKGRCVAVKLHFGEYGNLNYIRPPIVGAIIEALKENGARPFLFDTNTKYHGKRHTTNDHLETAKKNGFTEETMGCPILIGEKFVVKKTEHINVEIPTILDEADCVLVIAHAKGHRHCAGFGGVIKSMSMGFASPKSKKFQHQEAGPNLVGNCILCGTCASICPNKAIAVNKSWTVDIEKCNGCGRCINVCLQKALSHRIASLSRFFAEISKTVLENKACFFINVAMNVSEDCDCLVDAKFPICNDIGVFASEDPVATDAATIDAIKKNCPAFFDKMGLDPTKQIKEAENIGLGKSKYVLKHF